MTTIQRKFASALDELVEQLKLDRTILAAILCGSLSHDTVWEKSDIDLALITQDDTKFDCSHIALNAAGINVHALLMPRMSFRKTVEGAVRNSFMHSFLAKGRLLYTHDETLAHVCAQLGMIGERDTQIQLLSSATQALGPIDKAHKWFITRGDLNYTALWILHAANHLARIEVINARQLADREVLPQALKLNPIFFEAVYTRLLNTKKKTKTNVDYALDLIDSYLTENATTFFSLLLEYLEDAGEARSATEIETHFRRNFDIEGMTIACEFLADKGRIAKVSTPVKITRSSNVSVQELAFVHMGELPDAF